MRNVTHSSRTAALHLLWVGREVKLLTSRNQASVTAYFVALLFIRLPVFLGVLPWSLPARGCKSGRARVGSAWRGGPLACPLFVQRWKKSCNAWATKQTCAVVCLFTSQRKTQPFNLSANVLPGFYRAAAELWCCVFGWHAGEPFASPL